VASCEPAHRAGARDRPPAITVYGCEPDEAALFHELAPRFGVVATTTSDAVSEAGVVAVPTGRCASVGHTSELSRRELRALREAGVEHVSTRSIGVDHIDLAAAAELGITVENVAYSPDGVADFTLLLILTAIRSDLRSGGARGRDLRDLTVGVVGIGRIGRAVIGRLHGFGCRVLACSSGRGTTVAADVVSLDRLLGESDVVTLHVPLTAETRHLIGCRQIEAMKPGACLVNTARGALVDTDALIAALESGNLGGAALDVLEGEAPSGGRYLPRLRRLPNVVVTPHVAYRTVRTLSETVEATLVSCLTFERNRAHDQAQGGDLVRGVLRGA
jgi:D-specific alpha-keto acid dehydrogenase